MKVISAEEHLRGPEISIRSQNKAQNVDLILINLMAIYPNFSRNKESI